MIGTLISLAAAGLAVWKTVPELVRSRMWRDLLWFSVLLLVSVLLAVLRSTGTPLPNPLDLILAVFQPVSDWLFGPPFAS
ncbi:hypothetical protein J31TS4_27060 [Paenibacillus sp. J31TS4]|uniref:hypothetical protein n=1 Tax=Paenibacillus sp. J31TS4 TaxID=2807195 RepID=UPI001B09E010|nr:hypothetical protein [Paenibacillus sp. J31TS4]GIP39426.1 hypothetical protein J31TS4_27060 [Paenibacillus sp. J31TS4]